MKLKDPDSLQWEDDTRCAPIVSLQHAYLQVEPGNPEEYPVPTPFDEDVYAAAGDRLGLLRTGENIIEALSLLAAVLDEDLLVQTSPKKARK